MERYTDIDTVKNYLLKEIDSSYEDQINFYIDVMSRQIDSICKRTIYGSKADTFVYDGNNENVLLISDCTKITSVTVNGDELDAGDYYQYPQNKSYTSRLALASGYFPKGKQNIEVTAIQAMHDFLPDDIKFACTVFVAGIVNDQLFNDKKGITERIGNYQVSYKDDREEKDFEKAKRYLKGYQRITF